MSMNEAAMQARINFLVDQHADLTRAYAALARQRDEAFDSINRNAELVKEKTLELDRVDEQFAASQKAVIAARNERDAALQDIELLKVAGRKLEEQLAEVRRAPSYNSQGVSMPPNTYHLKLASGLVADSIKQDDCVVIVIRHNQRAPVMPGRGISRVEK